MNHYHPTYTIRMEIMVVVFITVIRRIYSNCCISTVRLYLLFELMFGKNQYVVWLCLLLVGVQTVSEIHSSNSTYFPIIKQMFLTCLSVPISNLGLCNNTCATCSTTNSYSCISCAQQFYLKNEFCLINRTISNYYYYSYFNRPTLPALYDNLQNFTFQDSGAGIGRDRLLALCSRPNATVAFNLFMFGLFKASEVVVLTYANIPNGIDRLYLKFNFLSVVQAITLHVDVNGQHYYKETGSVFSNLIGTYGINDTLTNPDGFNYLNLDGLSFSNPSNVIVSVSVSEIVLISQSIKIRFYADTPGKRLEFTQGMHDLVVVMRKCQTCVSKQLIALIYTTGRITGVLFAIVTVTVILLFIFIQIEEVLRKRKFQEKLGTSTGNMPSKTLNRVINNISNQIDKNFENAQKERQKTYKPVTNRANKDQ